jgi:hypothetical protein
MRRWPRQWPARVAPAAFGAPAQAPVDVASAAKTGKREKRDTPAVPILRIERPPGFELIDDLKPKQRKNHRGSQQTPREKFRAGRFVDTGANEEGFHLCGSVVAWSKLRAFGMVGRDDARPERSRMGC